LRIGRLAFTICGNELQEPPRMPFVTTRKTLMLASVVAIWPFGVWAESEPAQPVTEVVTASSAGAYLAAQVAASESDYAAAVEWYGRALAGDAANPALLDGAVLANIGAGDMELAAKLARELLAVGGKSQTATVALFADDAKAGNFEAILKTQSAGSSAGAVLDSLVKAWAKLGLGRMSEATEDFDKMAKTKGLEAFGLYHKALALASAGDFEGADAILSGKAAGTIAITRRGVIASVEILSQLERNADAVALLDRSFAPGGDIEVDDLRRRLTAGEPIPFTIVRNASDGISEVFFSMAGAVNGQADPAYTMIHARAAAYLRPENTEAQMLTASLLEDQGQHALAMATYALVAPTDPNFHIAEIGRASAMSADGQTDAGLKALEDLAQSHAQILSVQVALGDGMRREARFEQAFKAYDTAISMLTKAGPEHWALFFSRGICSESLHNFDAAEFDLRRALELNPNEPQVLNYLGYSLVDRGLKLDEALDMIKRAVAGKPDSGQITDSLAWAYFRLGRYAEALAPMEQASLMEPVDPIVTDHLGDVYWMNGRKREAGYQWRRALSYGPEEKDVARIQAKIDQGLDAVMNAEISAAPKPVDATAPVAPVAP
jgi:Flp pilus assembly protein TadD